MNGTQKEYRIIFIILNIRESIHHTLSILKEIKDVHFWKLRKSYKTMISYSGRIVKNQSACTKATFEATIITMNKNRIGIIKRQRVIPMFKLHHTLVFPVTDG